MGCTSSLPVPPSKKYSIPVPGTEKPGQTAVFRYAEKDLAKQLEKWTDVKTVKDLYLRSFSDYANKMCLGTRESPTGPYKFKTYAQIKDLSVKAGAAIVNLNLATPSEPEKLKFLGIWAKNREEWAITDFGATIYKHVLLPMYDSLGPDAIQFVFETTQVQTFFTSGDHVKELINGAKTKKFASLKFIISFDAVASELLEDAKNNGLTIYTWEDFLKNGEYQPEMPQIAEDDVYTFCYTSGTTSIPKAAIISHSNVISSLAGYEKHPALGWKNVKTADRYLSFLPLPHIFERISFPLMICRGVAVGFFAGDPLKLKEDMIELKPTVFAGVPRLYNRFYDIINGGIDKLPEGKKKKVKKIFATKAYNLKHKRSYVHHLYDKVVMKKMKAALGGQVRICVSGAAPLSADIGDFLKTAFCCPILEGFGATETCSGCFLQYPEQTMGGNIGGVMAHTEFKLMDVVEMNYTSQDKNEHGAPYPRGELCIRGPGVFKGYFKDEKNTKEAIDSENWYHTGDIAAILPDGCVKIIDRKKNIFKLSQGEYVAPERVENVYLTSKYISEVWVHGDSLQTYTVCVAIPNKEAVEALAKEKGVTGEFDEIIKNQIVKDAVLEDLNKIGKKEQLKGFELAKKIYLEPKSFVLLGLTTPTLKIKRNELKQHYQQLIKELYDDTKKIDNKI